MIIESAHHKKLRVCVSECVCVRAEIPVQSQSMKWISRHTFVFYTNIMPHIKSKSYSSSVRCVWIVEIIKKEMLMQPIASGFNGQDFLLPACHFVRVFQFDRISVCFSSPFVWFVDMSDNNVDDYCFCSLSLIFVFIQQYRKWDSDYFLYLPPHFQSHSSL